MEKKCFKVDEDTWISFDGNNTEVLKKTELEAELKEIADFENTKPSDGFLLAWAKQNNEDYMNYSNQVGQKEERADYINTLLKTLK